MARVKYLVNEVLSVESRLVEKTYLLFIVKLKVELQILDNSTATNRLPMKYWNRRSRTKSKMPDRKDEALNRRIGRYTLIESVSGRK